MCFFLLKVARQDISDEQSNEIKEIMTRERKYLDLESQYRIHHLERLRHQLKASVETHAVHLELMDPMRQCIVYSSNIAKTFLSTSGQSHPADFSHFKKLDLRFARYRFKFFYRFLKI